MFWGLVLEPSKKYTQKVEQTFHISQAALDLKSSDLEPIQIVVEYENSNFVLATLSKKANVYQVPLDLIFKTGDEVSFRTIGNGKVHLSGYHVLEDLDSMITNGEEESDIDELEEIVKGKGRKKKQSPMSKRNKRAKLEEKNADESDLDEEEEDFYEDDDDDDSEEEDEQNISVKTKTQKKNKKSNSSSLSLDDEDENEEDNYDEEEEEEEEEEEDEEMDIDDYEIDELTSGESSDSKKDKMNKSGKKKGIQTPNGVASNCKQKGTPAQKLKSPIQQEGTPKKGGKTPKSESKQASEKKSFSAENASQKKSSDNSKKEEKTPKSPKPKDSPQKKVLEGGVISEDIKVGNGPVAKPGKMANVYYVGSLASTKKEFDSVQSGGGFKFRIGRNEVIKGWDIGINGMKVGGKRRLTIPPHLAYGSKGSSPVIPPNSTLVFTVELKGLS